MTKTPWKTDKWFTSPWNFEPEVRAQLNFPKKIKLHDVTLRDGEQQTGLREDSGGGDGRCVLASKFVVSAKAGATNEVATTEVVIAFSAMLLASSANCPAC